MVEYHSFHAYNVHYIRYAFLSYLSANDAINDFKDLTKNLYFLLKE